MATSEGPLPRGALPLIRTRLIGREAPCASARAFLLDEAVPLLTLTGPGGVGKTRLALAIAHDVADSFTDGVEWVDLSPLQDPVLTLTTIAAALGVKPAADVPVTQSLAAALRSRQTLILLDNCEHVLEAVADIVVGLLAACPAVQMLATSRAPLHVRGEQEFPVDPLPLPPLDDASVAAVTENEAVRLFAVRARAVRPAFRVDETNAATVAALCRHLDGLPLAIELAAAHSKMLPPDVLLEHMSDRLRLLSGRARDLPTRQQTMAATIRWSCDLLAPDVRALFRRLSVFAGGWTIDAALAVADVTPKNAAAIEMLTTLVDQSLVRRVEQAPELRFAMLETIRAGGLEQLAASGEEPAVRRAHAAGAGSRGEAVPLLARVDHQWLQPAGRRPDNGGAPVEHGAGAAGGRPPGGRGAAPAGRPPPPAGAREAPAGARARGRGGGRPGGAARGEPGAPAGPGARRGGGGPAGGGRARRGPGGPAPGAPGGGEAGGAAATRARGAARAARRRAGARRARARSAGQPRGAGARADGRPSAAGGAGAGRGGRRRGGKREDDDGPGRDGLALAVAGDIARAFADGAVFVDLAAISEPELVAATVAVALGVTPGGVGDLAAEIVAQLRPAQVLLILDNCEHLVASAGNLVSGLLAGCPALQVLATSRAPLRLSPEQLLPVPPLAAPARDAPLRVIRSVPAARLFVQRAGAVDPRFALTEQNAEAVAELCQRLDGLPLAIELAAARANLLSPAALLALLSQRLQVLGTGPGDAPARHHTLHDAIAWSYDLLKPEEQRTFRHLAVFTGGWTLEAASAVCELPLPELVARLDALANQSLIVRRSAADASVPRFTMLETIREFGLERLHESGEEDAARTRHAAFFRDLVNALDLFYAFPGDASWLATIAPEEANLRQALEWFHAHGDARSLSELSGSLTPFWITRSQSVEGLRWLERAIAGDQDLSATLRAQCRETAGFFLMQLGDVAAAAPLIAECLALARSTGDLRLLRHTLQTRGSLAIAQRDFARAMALHVEAEHVARAVAAASSNGGLFIGAQLWLQGQVAQKAGDTTTAMARLAEAIPYLRAPGGSRRLGMVLGELGAIQIMTGSLDDAATNLLQSVAMTWHTHYETALARSLRGVCAAASVTDQGMTGAQLLGAADTMSARAPFLSIRAAPDRDMVEWSLTRLAQQLEGETWTGRSRLGARLEAAQAVALAREVIRQVLGADRVLEIWRETEAPDPGPAPTFSHLERSPCMS